MCLAEEDEKGFCAVGIDGIVADVQSQQSIAHQTLTDELDGLGDLVFQPAHEHVVDVEVLTNRGGTLMFLVALRMSAKP